MKGMQAIKRGNGFNGLLKYALSHEKANEDGRVIGGTMNGNDVKTLSAEFKESRVLRPDVAKPVWHNSLRLPAGDPCNDMKWGEIAQDYMTRMGFNVKKTQYVVVKHDDENAIHIIASRIQKDGTLYLGKNENLASTRHISALEKSHGLTITKGLEYDENNRIVSGRTNAGRLSAAEKQKALRTGVAAPKEQLKSIIAGVLAQGGCSAPVFKKRLADAGVQARENISSGDSRRLSGFSFEIEDNSNTKDNTVVFKGSQVGYGLKALQDAGVTYDSNKDSRITKTGVSLVDYVPPPEPVLQPSQDELRMLAWDRQMTALDADSYIVHCDRDSDDLELVEPSTKTYTAHQVRNAIVKIGKVANNGYSVSVEPVSERWNYIMCHGIETHEHSAMSAAGYAAALVLETSQGKADVVLRVPKVSDRSIDEQAAQKAGLILTHEFGDTDVHMLPKKIPLAGFKQRGFITSVIEASSAVCTKTKQLFDGIVAHLKTTLVRKVNKGPTVDDSDILPGNVPKQVQGQATPNKGPTGPSIDGDGTTPPTDPPMSRGDRMKADMPTWGNGGNGRSRGDDFSR